MSPSKLYKNGGSKMAFFNEVEDKQIILRANNFEKGRLKNIYGYADVKCEMIKNNLHKITVSNIASSDVRIIKKTFRVWK